MGLVDMMAEYAPTLCRARMRASLCQESRVARKVPCITAQTTHVSGRVHLCFVEAFQRLLCDRVALGL